MTFSEWRSEQLNNVEEVLNRAGLVPEAKASALLYLSERIDIARTWSAYGEAPPDSVVDNMLNQYTLEQVLDQNEISDAVVISLLCASGIMDINEYIVPEDE